MTCPAARRAFLCRASTVVYPRDPAYPYAPIGTPLGPLISCVTW